MPLVPTPRGDLTQSLLSALAEPVHRLDVPDVPAPADPLADEDLQLALYAMYELHYRGFDGVDEAWEWEPTLLELRRSLEQVFLRSLFDLAGPPAREDVYPGEMDVALRAVAESDDGPSLSRHLERRCSLEELL